MKTLFAFFAFLLATSAQAQVYSLHPQFLGIYWDPGLAGTGVGIDIQNGVLFGTVYTPRPTGDDGFLTLISSEADPEDQTRFSGDVFRLRDGGAVPSEDVGDFALQIGSVIGQPGMLLTMTSPYLDLENRLLVRFGYNDGDQLGPLAGKLWGISFTSLDADPLSSLDFIAGFFFIDAERITLADGTPALGVLTGADLFGIAYYDGESESYVIEVETTPRELLVFDVTSSHSDMFGDVIVVRDGEVDQVREFVGAAATSTRGGGLAKARADGLRSWLTQRALRPRQALYARSDRIPRLGARP